MTPSRVTLPTVTLPRVTLPRVTLPLLWTPSATPCADVSGAGRCWQGASLHGDDVGPETERPTWQIASKDRSFVAGPAPKQLQETLTVRLPDAIRLELVYDGESDSALGGKRGSDAT
jgi:hypothetical protein